MAWNYDVHILAASPEFDLYPVWKSYNDGCSIIVHLQLEFSPFSGNLSIINSLMSSEYRLLKFDDSTIHSNFIVLNGLQYYFRIVNFVLLLSSIEINCHLRSLYYHLIDFDNIFTTGKYNNETLPHYQFG